MDFLGNASFGAGVTLQNLVMHRVGEDLVIVLQIDVTNVMPLTGDTLMVKDWFHIGRRVERLRFANGEEIRIGDVTSFIAGTSGPDVIIGTFGADFIVGGVGNDEIGGLSGDDYGFGGAGDDFVAGDADNDWVIGGDDEDQVVGGQGNDAVFGDGGDERLFGRTRALGARDALARLRRRARRSGLDPAGFDRLRGRCGPRLGIHKWPEHKCAGRVA